MIKIWCGLDVRFVICGILCKIGPIPLNLEADYGLTIRAIELLPGCFNRIGPETMCTDFCEIWTKYVGGGAKSVF